MLSHRSRLLFMVCWIAFFLVMGVAVRAAAEDQTATSTVALARNALGDLELWIERKAQTSIAAPRDSQARDRAGELIRTELRTQKIGLQRLRVHNSEQEGQKQELLRRLTVLEQRGLTDAPTRSTKTGSVSVSGTVRDALTDEPIEGVIVQFSIAFSGVQAVTDSAGFYDVDLFGPGEWLVQTLSEDYLERHEIVDFGDSENLTYDISLTVGARISGAITIEGTDDAIPSATVTAFDDAGQVVLSTLPDELGNYLLTPLPSGSIYVATASVFIDQTWAGVVCEGDLCNPTNGAPINTVLGQTSDGIDFALATNGHTITGRSWDASSGAPALGQVSIYDHNGHHQAWAFVMSNGAYGVSLVDQLSDPLVPATWYVGIEPYGDYVAETWDTTTCAIDCDRTDGTPVVTHSQTTSAGIDFSLVTGSLLSGTLQIVSQRSSRETRRLIPSSASVELFDANGSMVGRGTHYFLFNVDWSLRVPAGTYYIKTESTEFDNLLWQGILCEPSCTPTDGTAITVDDEETASGIDFFLDSEVRIFSDGFENGTAWRWSEIVGIQ